MGLYEKMYNVMNESPALEKSMKVGSGSYSYKAIGEAEVLNAVKPLFKKYKLIIFPIGSEVNEIVSEIGGKTRAITQVKVTYKIVDIETSESVEVVGIGNGADTQDKGAGKAFTYALKSALSKTFMLFSGDDTDNTHSNDIYKEKKEEIPKKPSEPEWKALAALAKRKGINMTEYAKENKFKGSELLYTEYIDILTSFKEMEDA